MYKIVNIRTSKSLLVASALLLFCLGCNYATESDAKNLKVLQSKYGDKFYFKLDDEFYLKVTLKKEMQVDESELREIYKNFFFDEAKKRRNTSFVYLNFYNSRSEFQYQISFDYVKNEFVKNHAEHY